MLEFTDAPYRFFPPKPLPPLMRVCRWANRRWFLPRKPNWVTDFTLGGAVDAVRTRRKAGSRFLFVGNHPSNADPFTMGEVQRRLGVQACFMTAYDVFLKQGKLRAWFMQRNGAFSVDRDGSDGRSMRAAMDILREGDYALTVFPEGNVYMMNDRVMPFLEGAAFLALKAQRDLGGDAPIHAVPVSMKFTHLRDVRAEVRQRLDGLARIADTALDPSAPPVDELVRIGRRLMFRLLRQRGYFDGNEHAEVDPREDLPGELQQLVGRLVAALEAKLELEPRAIDAPLDRLRRCRSRIHEIRTDPERTFEQRAAVTWADEAMLALRILGYAQPYVAEHPTLDRYAETVDRLSEDVHSERFPAVGPRKAIVEVGAPIDLAERLASARRLRGAVQSVTADLEAAVQAGLDRANQANPHPGGTLY